MIRNARLLAFLVLTLTGRTGPLMAALRRLAKDNLANLHPHPLYALFHYSRPPLAERIASLEAMERRSSS
jgi:STE24 endopeptidase